MTIEQYVAEIKAKVDKFEKDWLEKQKADPANYPNDLSPGDWDEQFLAVTFDIIL